MKTKKWLVIAMAAILAVGGLILVKVHADETKPSRLMRGRFLMKAKKALDLSDDQVVKIKGQFAADKDKLTTLLSAWNDARVNLREVIQKPGSSEADIRAAAAKVAAVESDFAVERASLYGRISPILNAEQLDKIDEFQQKVDDFVDGAIAVFGKRLAE